MPATRIAKKSVEAVLPGPRDVYLWDDMLKGFGLKVTPKAKRVYLVQYRAGGRGRSRRFTIGQHGVMTADQARAEAKRLLGRVAQGFDPSEDRDQRRAEPTMGEALKTFLEEHVDSKLKPSSAHEYHRIVRLYITRPMKRRRITEITRANIARLHHSMRTKPYQANRLLALLSKFFNWCELRGLRPDHSNPCRHVEKYKEQKRQRFLSPAELQRLGEALTQVSENGTESPWVVGAIRLLLLTGARLSEILTLRWDYVDEDNLCLRLPDSKTGSKTIHLSKPALEVLSSIPRLDGNPHVICGKIAGTHTINLQKPWRRIRALADLADVRLHDLRHTFASVAAIGGISLPIIGGLIGHSQPQTTARYAHLSADPLRAANDTIGSQIAGAMKSDHQH